MADEHLRNRAHSRSDPHLRLSKTKLLAHRHCPKRLWLQVHRPELARFSPETKALFAAGHIVGEAARAEVGDGTLVDTGRDVGAALSETRRLLEGPWDRPIFEPAFQREDVLIRADVLQPDGWGGWALIEVKNSTGVRPYQLFDIATQEWVVSAARLCISSLVIRHVAHKFRVSPGSSEFRGRFVDVDVTAEARRCFAAVEQEVVAARATVRGPPPSREPGAHCTRPFACEFQAYCGGRQAALHQ